MRKPLTRPVLLIGSTANCPDILYGSGFWAPDPVVFLRTRRQDFLVVSQLEFGRASRTGKRISVLTPTHLALRGNRRRKLSGWALALLRKANIRWVTVPRSFPYAIARELEKAGIRLSIGEDPIFPERAVKRPAEVHHLRESQQAAVIAVRAAVSMIADSQIGRGGVLMHQGKRLTSEAVQRHIAGVLLKHDCMTERSIVAGGEQAVDPHENGHGPLRAHEAIVIDIFPRHTHHGYWGDITRTVVKGTPSQELREMYQAVRSAQRAALGRIKPGVGTKTVHHAAARALLERGFDTRCEDGQMVGFIHGTGHGVGLCIHEEPAIAATKDRLRSGHVITVEPGLYYPGVGGIRIEDTVVVTPSGWRYLASCEKRFEV